MDTTEHDNTDIDNSPQDMSTAELVRTSGVAAAACVLAVASLLLLPGLRWALRRDTPESVQSLYLLTLCGTLFFGGLLGVVGLAQIATSGGRLTGKGFACVGVVVPVAVVFLLFFAGFARMGGTAYRMVCGSNLSGIGKAMLIYANDYEDRLPFAGGGSSQWTGRVVDWTAPNRQGAYGLSADGSGGQVSISASLYLLVKYAGGGAKAVFSAGQPVGKTRRKGSDGIQTRDLSRGEQGCGIDRLFGFRPEIRRSIAATPITWSMDRRR